MLADIRSDRFSFFEGETVRLESYVCNDLGQQQVTVKYQAELLTESQGEILSDAENHDFVMNVIGSGEKEISVPACSSEFAGFVTFEIPKLAGFLKEKEESEKAEGIRTVRLRVRMTVEKNGVVLHGTEEVFPVYPREESKEFSLLTLKDLGRKPLDTGMTIRLTALLPSAAQLCVLKSRTGSRKQLSPEGKGESAAEALLSMRISAKMGHVRKQQFFGRVPDF